MAKWLSFSRDWDFKHPSRAVTAYKAGMVEYVPNHIADRALAERAADVAEKPEHRDGRTWLNG